MQRRARRHGHALPPPETLNPASLYIPPTHTMTTSLLNVWLGSVEELIDTALLAGVRDSDGEPTSHNPETLNPASFFCTSPLHT